MATERRIGVAIDFSSSSKSALKWAMENVIRKEDHLILITIQPEGNYEKGEMQLWEGIGSLKHDPEVVDIVSNGAKQKEVEVLMKVYWGDPREKLCEAIDSIPLSCIIVGNRGLGKLKRAIMGSVSNYVVNNGSCAVTVVKHHE
ncbi:universal stress protein A-like protein [Gossypium australe]|uniref:Universal stress protein A-like protein n=1 Tax=Gossypium australe TaxID=47621 RepID=A0A5B6WUR0_9ROSI|nr:universal stress protein A-like protein [Gossypium australe]